MDLINVMVVDDDILAIEDLEDMINWEENGFNLVAHTTNPLIGIELFKKHQPQIVIVDIYMPIMDGVKFSKAILSLNSHVKIILLSSYRDFDYAKEAISIGLSNYLIKNEINETTLLAELSKLKNELIAENKSMRLLRRQRLQDTLNDNRHVEDKLEIFESEQDNKGHSYVLVYLGLAKPFPIYPIENEIEHLEIDCSGWIDDSLLDGFDWGEILTLSKGQLVVLLSFKRMVSEKRIYDNLYKVAYRLQCKFKEQSNDRLTVLTSSRFYDIGKLPEVSRKLEKASEYCVFYNKDKIVREHEITDSMKLVFNGSVDFKKLDEALMTMNKKDIEDNLDLIFKSDDILRHNMHALKKAIKEVKLALANLRKKHKLIPITNGTGLSEKDIFEWFNVKDIHRWFKKKLIETIEDIKIKKSRNYSAKVLKAIEFIEKNYAKDIHIEDIANVIGISGAYLRLRFKEETKMTINEYITNIRVEKAIELLENGEYKVYEVAEMVGYGNSQYFSQVFKKISGKPPRSFINGNEEAR